MYWFMRTKHKLSFTFFPHNFHHYHTTVHGAHFDPLLSTYPSILSNLIVTSENTFVFKVGSVLSSQDILLIVTCIPPAGSRFYEHSFSGILC